MNRWWEVRSDERYWLEITDRPDLGVDLKAPQAGDNGAEQWSYSFVTEVRDGDIAFHYWKPQAAITACSRVVGTHWEEDIVWGSHGTVAREAGVVPYTRPGWRVGLEGFTPLSKPVTLEDLRSDEAWLSALRRQLEADTGGTVYFPIAFSDKRPARPQQGYLAKLPSAMLGRFPALGEGAREASRRVDSPDADPTTGRQVGGAYRPADELASTSERDAFSVDPAIVERGLRGHAATQNALAEYVTSLGFEPRSPRPGEPNFDVAWQQGTTTFVAEVKSTTASNEEKQLRLGLGQVLRYRQLLGAETTKAVLAVEGRPKDERWIRLCADVGVVLAWPGNFHFHADET